MDGVNMMTSGNGNSIRTAERKILDDKILVYIVGGLIFLFLFSFMVVPIANILKLSISPYVEETRRFEPGITLENFKNYLTNPSIVQSLYNSIYVSLWSSLITTVLAFLFAYGLQRTTIKFKKVIYYMSMAPLVAPALLQAMVLISLFGSNGLITNILNLNWNIYGANGIIISEVLYCFPHAMIILYTTLSAVDTRLDEAAASLGSSGVSTFFRITIPTAKYGIFSAAALTFNLTITDFGNPIIIGRGYKVLSTEIFTQVIGMQRFDMGATIAVVLLIPSVAAFMLNYYFSKKSHSLVSSASKPELSPTRPLKKLGFGIFCWFVSGVLASVIVVVVVKAFINVWMYDWNLTLRHFSFQIAGGRGVLWTSFWISITVAIVSAIVTMINGYIIEKKKPFFAQPLYMMSVIPAAIPGLVFGLSYILLFNTRFMNLDQLFYGQALAVIVVIIVQNFTLGTLSSISNMKHIDKEMDEAATSLGSGIVSTFARVIFPLNRVSFFSNLTYYFMRSMVIISAVVFLISADVHLASISVINLQNNGYEGQASAMTTLIIAIIVAALVILNLGLKLTNVNKSKAGK